MKILYLSQHPRLNLASPDGPGTHMREIINVFRSLGNEVLPVIFGGTEQRNNLSETTAAGGTKRFLKMFTPSIIWESIKDFRLLQGNAEAEKILTEHIQKFQPGLIYERAGYMQLAGARVAKKFNITHFVEFNALLTEERKMLQGGSLMCGAGEKLEKELLTSSDKIIVVSSKLKENFIQKFHCDENKFIVTPNAVNFQLIKTDDRLKNEIKSKYNLGGKTVIGFVGSIFKYHGVDILLDAFKKVLRKEKNVILMIVGDGEVLNDLKRQTQTENISADVIFTGNVSHSHVYNYISLFDIAVLPKTKEYMSPIKIFEYGALGKATIAPDVSSVRDVITNGENGLLINSIAEEISSAILTLIQDAELIKKLGNNFQRKVLSEHTWEKMAKKILSSIQ